ncbi:MAG TPA: Fis family transcriptional regulator [Achromobacter sp.]|nr:Fis family transcriptional regulator [Achromobacter sp.]
MKPEYLRLKFEYDTSSGRLFWRVGAGPRTAGTEAGYIDRHGYRRVCVDGRKWYTHQIVWLMVIGDELPERIYHRNGDKQDNRPGNIRAATQSQNMMNTRKRSNNTSGRKGVYWHKGAKRWLAQIKVGGQHHYLGLHATIELAAAAYAQAASKFHGSFARLA